LHWSCCRCAVLSLNIRCKIFIISIVVFCICHLSSKIMIMQIKKVVAKFKVKVCFVICLSSLRCENSNHHVNHMFNHQKT
jgi:hypothetical protein